MSKKSVVKKYAQGRENILIEAYIEHGPSKLQQEIDISPKHWLVVFDYLVFEHNLLYKCIISNTQFFVDEYVRHGSSHIREMLNIVNKKYDLIWNFLFDFIAISNDGLYYHVLHHRDRYMLALKARGSDFVRKVLGVWKPKYEENWSKVLDILLNAVCESIFSEQTFEHGLNSFCRLMNGVREHRPIFKSGII